MSTAPTKPSGPATRRFRHRQLVGILNNLAFLIQWCRPGKRALFFGRMKSAFEAPTLGFDKERNKIIDELVMWDIKPGEKDKPADDQKRVRRTRLNEQGVSVFDFGPNDEEATKRLDDLSEDTVDITFPRLLTEADIDEFETKDRITSLPKNAKGDATALQSVDFSALLCIIEGELAAAETVIPDEPPPAPAAT